MHAGDQQEQGHIEGASSETSLWGPLSLREGGCLVSVLGLILAAAGMVPICLVVMPLCYEISRPRSFIIGEVTQMI